MYQTNCAIPRSILPIECVSRYTFIHRFSRLWTTNVLSSLNLMIPKLDNDLDKHKHSIAQHRMLCFMLSDFNPEYTPQSIDLSLEIYERKSGNTSPWFLRIVKLDTKTLPVTSEWVREYSNRLQEFMLQIRESDPEQVMFDTALKNEIKNFVWFDCANGVIFTFNKNAVTRFIKHAKEISSDMIRNQLPVYADDSDVKNLAQISDWKKLAEA